MKYVFIATVTLFCTALSAACGDRQPRSGVAVYLDESQPVEKRVEDALSRMTLEEKSCQLATLYGYGRVLRDSTAHNIYDLDNDFAPEKAKEIKIG